MICVTLVNNQRHTQTAFDQLVRAAQPQPAELKTTKTDAKANSLIRAPLQDDGDNLLSLHLDRDQRRGVQSVLTIAEPAPSRQLFDREQDCAQCDRSDAFLSAATKKTYHDVAQQISNTHTTSRCSTTNQQHSHYITT